MIARFDFDALQSFAVFADALNFSAAARELHISQPALHVKVAKLAAHAAGEYRAAKTLPVDPEKLRGRGRR